MRISDNNELVERDVLIDVVERVSKYTTHGGYETKFIVDEKSLCPNTVLTAYYRGMDINFIKIAHIVFDRYENDSDFAKLYRKVEDFEREYGVNKVMEYKGCGKRRERDAYDIRKTTEALLKTHGVEYKFTSRVDFILYRHTSEQFIKSTKQWA